MIYTHATKGGQYRLLFSDTLPAGEVREMLGTGTEMVVYQDIETNKTYVRSAADFKKSMNRVVGDVVY